ncbi:hypothetical protein DH2020_040640 [Rehmannia glutinosa]|uniref:J domain-containing protein n=1 Tax=Rehmannia glutinosa TaxID=99300 RepID=A0ABR0USE5_REHGL
MQVLRRWRNVLILKNSITQSTRVATVATPTTHSASFHSTSAFFEKWRNKFDSDFRGDQSSKNYIRYAVRQKRADTKKALKNILFKGGCSTSKAESFPNIEADYAVQLNKRSRIKPARQAKRANHKKSKLQLLFRHGDESDNSLICPQNEEIGEKIGRNWTKPVVTFACSQGKHRRENVFEDFDENPDRIFHAAFGKQGFTWTFRPSGMRFEWTENYWSNSRFNQQDGESRTGSGDESFILGTCADRNILGLPMAGPLKIEDVKAAFRLSALKWHPDKHQGSSKNNSLKHALQLRFECIYRGLYVFMASRHGHLNNIGTLPIIYLVMAFSLLFRENAEEKFKHCVDAYKSLCNTFSTA